MENITWKHVALLAIFVLAMFGLAGLYTFGGEAGQEATSSIGTVFFIVLILVWISL